MGSLTDAPPEDHPMAAKQSGHPEEGKAFMCPASLRFIIDPPPIFIVLQCVRCLVIRL